MKKKTKAFVEKRPKGMSRTAWMMSRSTFKALHYDRVRAEAAAAAVPAQTVVRRES